MQIYFYHGRIHTLMNNITIFRQSFKEQSDMRRELTVACEKHKTAPLEYYSFSRRYLCHQ